MRSTITAAALLSAVHLATAQTFTSCDPLNTTCPGDSGIGNKTPFVTDFTKLSGSDTPKGWSLADGTKMSYDSNGANFAISTKTGAPTMSTDQYIFFGSVEVWARASPGTGIVSSFILESDDLDEIDWEWLGSTDNVKSAETNFFGKGNVTTYDRAIYYDVPNIFSQFHNYTIVWTKDYVSWQVDGVEKRNLAFLDEKTHGGTQFPQTPMKIKMGNWVGCADAAAASNPATQGTCQWAGGPVSFDSVKSYSMYVANVTIKDQGCGGTYTYTDNSGKYQSIKSSNDGTGNCGIGADVSSAPASSASGTASIVPVAPTSASVSAQTTSVAQTSTNTSTTAIATGSGSGSNGTTLATATPTSGSGSGSTSKVGSDSGASSTTSSGSAQVTANGGAIVKPSHKYGGLDVAVMVLGLGLGYLVM